MLRSMLDKTGLSKLSLFSPSEERQKLTDGGANQAKKNYDAVPSKVEAPASTPLGKPKK